MFTSTRQEVPLYHEASHPPELPAKHAEPKAVRQSSSSAGFQDKATSRDPMVRKTALYTESAGLAPARRLSLQRSSLRRSGTCGRDVDLQWEPTLQRSVRQTERRIPAAAVAVERWQGRAGSRAALQSAAVGVQERTYRCRTWCTNLEAFSLRAGQSMKRRRIWRLRHMRDAWLLLLRTICGPGWLQSMAHEPASGFPCPVRQFAWAGSASPV